MNDIVDYKSLLDNLQTGICRCVLGKDITFQFANLSFRDMFGLSSDVLGQARLKDLFVDSSEYNTVVRMIREQQIFQNVEARLKGKKKEPCWCSLSASRVCDNKTKREMVDIHVENISIRKTFERELSESKDMFQTVFNNTAAAITVSDKNERIVAWNRFAETMLDMGKEDLFNLPVKELYPAKEWRRLRAFRIRRKGMLADIETQMYRKDRTVLDVNVSISILKDIDGKIIGSIGIIHDITNQKLAERKIRESENRVRIILDNSPAAITLTDDKERIILWNKFTEEFLGMNKKDLYLQPVSYLYPEDEWKKIRAANIRKTGSKHHLQTKVVKKDGQVIDVDLSINVLKDEQNNIVGSVGVMQDITEQKKAHQLLLDAKKEAEIASNMKTMFLANMSHEVRTPMNAILGMIDLTLETELTKEQEDNLSIAKEAASNLLALINDILDLSSVESGKMQLENIPLNIHNLARSVIKGMAVLAKAKENILELKIDKDVPELVKGDPVRIRQILINLINNAVKFTEKGTIIVDLKTLGKDNDKVELQLSVIDEGIGIPKGRLDKIFESFTQADSSTTRKYGGTGLGLTISQKLVEMMGGRIWVESEVGKGSMFAFTGRFDTIGPDEIVSLALDEVSWDEHIEEEKKRDLANLRVLLADDNLVNQKVTARMLEKQGWKVATAFNGYKVLEQLEKQTFDVILMDAEMPEMDGFEATQEIRKREKETKAHIPIIALTGRAMEEDRNKCMKVGMDGFVTKPVDRAKLLEEIHKLVKKGK